MILILIMIIIMMMIIVSSAILFMCEIDNFCYAVGLSERVRSRVESLGHIELSTEDAATLVRMKATHLTVLPCSVVGGVMLAGSDGKLANLGMKQKDATSSFCRSY
eukprot:COSAG02_NODE_5151_length_4588_cov_2.905324_3_plen_106_part_00